MTTKVRNDTWAPVEGFPDYSVSPLGQVRKDSTGRVLHTRINQYGVPYVGLMRGPKQCIRSLPRLVAQAFIEPPALFDQDGMPVFDTPINLNGDRTDCRVDNLAWRPRWYAVSYANQFKDRYDHPIKGRIREVETGQTFSNSLDAGCAYGVLEREVVLSIMNNTLTWPTYQQFELV